jgi:GntR family transcriptional regulator
MVEKGFWRPGEKLPGERELADKLSVSLGTVQSAMRSLAATGLVERRRGAGSFITDTQDLGDRTWHFRFLSSDGRILLPFEIDVLAIEEVTEKGAWSDFFGPCPSFVRITRILVIGREFKTYSQVYLDAARFRPLLDLPLEVLSGKNLREFLHDRFNAPTLHAVHRLRAQPVNPQIAAMIECEPDAPGILMDALGYTYREAPISFQRIVIPPTNYFLEIRG